MAWPARWPRRCQTAATILQQHAEIFHAFSSFPLSAGRAVRPDMFVLHTNWSDYPRMMEMLGRRKGEGKGRK